MKGALIADRRMSKGTVLVISPHLDDAVLACGRLLAQLARFCRVVVATVFAGRPGAPIALTAWDEAGGFVPGNDVVGMRREEDRCALRLLGARHCWLPFLDSQYGETPSPREVASALLHLWLRERPRYVLFPLGLFHSDHHRVRDAVLLLRRLIQRRTDLRQTHWLAFEDALYRRLPGLLFKGVTHMRRAGLHPSPVRFVGSAWSRPRKHAAVACYVSQLKALATPGRLGHEDAFVDEGYVFIGVERGR